MLGISASPLIGAAVGLMAMALTACQESPETQIDATDSTGVTSVPSPALPKDSVDDTGAPLKKLANSPPQVDAGADKRVAAGTILSLRGLAEDRDGFVAQYHWIQTEGSPVTLSNPGQAVTLVVVPEQMAPQRLKFKLQVLDNDGESQHDELVLEVVDAGQRATLAASAQSDEISIEGLDSAALRDAELSLQDNDGSAVALPSIGGVVRYHWRQIEGPPVDLGDGDTGYIAFAIPKGAKAQHFVFELSTIDDQNLSSTQWVKVDTRPPNTPPQILAPRLIEAKVNQRVLLRADAHDDGVIAQYRWKQTAGAPLALMGANAPDLSFVAPGQAQRLRFELRVTDDQGAISTALVQVVVSAAD